MSQTIVYPYRICAISFSDDKEVLLGVEVVPIRYFFHISAHQLFYKEDWFTRFSPDNVRAIAGFAIEDQRKRIEKAILGLDQEPD